MLELDGPVDESMLSFELPPELTPSFDEVELEDNPTYSYTTYEIPYHSDITEANINNIANSFPFSYFQDDAVSEEPAGSSNINSAAADVENHYNIMDHGFDVPRFASSYDPDYYSQNQPYVSQVTAPPSQYTVVDETTSCPRGEKREGSQGTELRSRRAKYPPYYFEDPSSTPTRSVCVTRWNSMAAQKILSLSTLDIFYLSKTVQKIQIIAEKVAFAKLCLFYVHATIMGFFIGTVSFCDAVCSVSNLTWCLGWLSRFCMLFNSLVLLTGLGLASVNHVARSVRCVHGTLIIVAVTLTFTLDTPSQGQLPCSGLVYSNGSSALSSVGNITASVVADFADAQHEAQNHHIAFWLLVLNKLSYVIILVEGACGAFFQSLATI